LMRTNKRVSNKITPGGGQPKIQNNKVKGGKQKPFQKSNNQNKPQ